MSPYIFQELRFHVFLKTQIRPGTILSETVLSSLPNLPTLNGILLAFKKVIYIRFHPDNINRVNRDSCIEIPGGSLLKRAGMQNRRWNVGYGLKYNLGIAVS